jgi:hypothetical protein
MGYTVFCRYSQGGLLPAPEPMSLAPRIIRQNIKSTCGTTLRRRVSFVAASIALLAWSEVVRARDLPIAYHCEDVAATVTGRASCPVHQDLKRVLHTWQKKLGLTDWTIGVEVVSDSALGGNAMGDVVWDLILKRAAIRILREEEYDLPGPLARLDQQATVLHELVH